MEENEPKIFCEYHAQLELGRELRSGRTAWTDSPDDLQVASEGLVLSEKANSYQ